MPYNRVKDCITLLNPCPPPHHTHNLCTRFLANGAIAAYSYYGGQFIITCVDGKPMQTINVPHATGRILAVDRTNAHTVVLVRNDRSVSVLLYAGRHVVDRCIIMQDYVHGLRLYATSDSEFAVVCINKRKKGPITVYRFTIRATHVFFCISYYETYHGMQRYHGRTPMCDYKLLLTSGDDDSTTYLDVIPRDVVKMIAEYLSTDRIYANTRQSPVFNMPAADGHSLCVVGALDANRLIVEKYTLSDKPHKGDRHSPHHGTFASSISDARPEYDLVDNMEYYTAGSDWQLQPHNVSITHANLTWTASRITYTDEDPRNTDPRGRFVIADHTGAEILRMPTMWRAITLGAIGCDIENAASIRLIDEQYASCTIVGTTTVFNHRERYFTDRRVTCANHNYGVDSYVAICGNYTVFLREHRIQTPTLSTNKIVYSIIITDAKNSEIYTKEIVTIMSAWSTTPVWGPHAPRIYNVPGEQAVIIVTRVPVDTGYYFRVTKYKIFDTFAFVNRKPAVVVPAEPDSDSDDSDDDDRWPHMRRQGGWSSVAALAGVYD